jgi:broad specificity phosphatase PhoE
MMNLKQAIFVRHGETQWNAERRWQGHTDIPLNSRGILQARKVAKKVAIHHPEMIISSDLSRAFQTARIIGNFIGIPVTPTIKLREVSIGDAEGMTMDQVVEHFGQDKIELWRSTEPSALNFSFPNGELKKTALERGRNAIEEYMLVNPAVSIGFVFHGMLMRTLLHDLFPSIQEPVTIVNCKHFILNFDVDSRKWMPAGELSDLVNAA